MRGVDVRPTCAIFDEEQQELESARVDSEISPEHRRLGSILSIVNTVEQLWPEGGPNLGHWTHT